VIFGGDRRDHVTPLLRDKLHWLRAKERITFKLCLLVDKVINGLAPSYLQDLCVPLTTVYTRSALRSAARGDLVVPCTRRRIGNRAFCVARPMAWNSLPPDIRTASSLITFKNQLKTHLFTYSFYLIIQRNFRVLYAVWRPCNDFMDMLRRLTNCRIIIIIIIIINWPTVLHPESLGRSCISQSVELYLFTYFQ